MLTLTYARLATVEDLFRYKAGGFSLEPFPGYTPDQWGIKAHNRPWVEEAGRFVKGQRVLEVGGAYSTLPKYLAEKYGVEAWIGDDFGESSGDALWARWGNPRDLPTRYPSVRYVFQNMGTRSPEFPDRHFDCIFSVSTLEHVPPKHRRAVFEDMHRCLRPGGMQLHTIDIPVGVPTRVLRAAILEKLPLVPLAYRRRRGSMRDWVETLRESGVRIACDLPNPLALLDRRMLVDSADVVYRFYPPNDAPKEFRATASLLLVIEDR